MTRFPTSILALAVVWCSVAWAMGPQDPDDLHKFMQRKLALTQDVLHGITTGQTGMIGENARALSAMPEEEIWKVLQTPEYIQLSDSFRRAAEGLATAGDNLDAAGISYIALATSCFDCHRHVRENRGT